MSGAPRISTRTGFPVRPYRRRIKLMKNTATRSRRAIGKIRRFLPLAGFPSKKVVRLRYVETVTGAISTWANYVFSCNSCFDPNVSGTGHQPYGFDQWALIYDHYKVLGSKMTLTATMQNNQNTSGYIYGIKVDDNGSAVTNINSLMEQKDSCYKVVVGQNAPSYLSKKWSMRKNLDPTLDGIQAQVNASPADQEYYIIYAASADTGSSVDGRLAIQVQIDYIVEFSELKDFANS